MRDLCHFQTAGQLTDRLDGDGPTRPRAQPHPAAAAHTHRSSPPQPDQRRASERSPRERPPAPHQGSSLARRRPGAQEPLSPTSRQSARLRRDVPKSSLQISWFNHLASLREDAPGRSSSSPGRSTRCGGGAWPTSPDGDRTVAGRPSDQPTRCSTPSGTGRSLLTVRIEPDRDRRTLEAGSRDGRPRRPPAWPKLACPQLTAASASRSRSLIQSNSGASPRTMSCIAA